MTAAVLLMYGTTCHLCLRRGATTRDHIVPLNHGGLDTLENCRPAHHRCNSKRQDRALTPALLAEFRPSIPPVVVDASRFFENGPAREPRAQPPFSPRGPAKNDDLNGAGHAVTTR